MFLVPVVSGMKPMASFLAGYVLQLFFPKHCFPKSRVEFIILKSKLDIRALSWDIPLENV